MLCINVHLLASVYHLDETLQRENLANILLHGVRIQQAPHMSSSLGRVSECFSQFSLVHSAEDYAEEIRFILSTGKAYSAIPAPNPTHRTFTLMAKILVTPFPIVPYKHRPSTWTKLLRLFDCSGNLLCRYSRTSVKWNTTNMETTECIRYCC